MQSTQIKVQQENSENVSYTNQTTTKTVKNLGYTNQSTKRKQ
jgi:hypothetical protein